MEMDPCSVRRCPKPWRNTTPILSMILNTHLRLSHNSAESFSVRKIEKAILSLPPRKAILPDLPPAIGSQQLGSAYTSRTSETLVPGAMLAPKALRPICIQHPICKVLDGLAVEHALQEQPDLFLQLPCFAYIKHRAAEDCILKAAHHCAAVKSLLQRPTHPQAAHHASLQGGLQVCADLSQALDRVPRQLAEDSIRAAGYTREVEASMMISLHGGVFQIHHKGLRTQVPCTRGIKQGDPGEGHTNGIW